MTSISQLVIVFATTALVACSSSEVSNSVTTDNAPDTGANPAENLTDADADADAEEILNTSLFRTLISDTVVDCTLDNGVTTSCHQLAFNVNQVRDSNGNLIDSEAGPFCPSGYLSTDGGVGFYDGASNPGFQNLSQELWDSMAADGFDLIDEETGAICIEDPLTRERFGNNCTAYCLAASADNSLTATYLIPVTPVNLDTPAVVGSVQPVGLSLDGVPITGTPPSVVDGPGRGAAGGNIPSLDHCGGHHDPRGYYHWHLIPESADAVHEASGTNNQADCVIPQVSTALSGFAKDGYPIYAYQDQVNGAAVTPTDLDECNGHIGATSEYPDGVYHYHATLDAPSLPPCVTGASVDQRQSPSIQ